MAQPLRMRRSLLFAKVESTYNQDSNPDETNDAVVVLDFDPGVEIDVNERETKDLSIGQGAERGGKARSNLSFSTELRGSGVAGDAPKGDDALFRMAGFAPTNNPGVSHIYDPRSSGFESATIYANIDGVRHAITGCIANLELALVAGETAKCNWTVQAPFALPVDAAIPASQSPNATLPPVCKNMTVSLDGYTPKVHSISFNLNNVIAERPDLGSNHAIAGFALTNRNVDGEIVIEAVTRAEKDFWASLNADSLVAMSIVLGSVAGNIITITCPAVRFRQIQWGDQDALATYTIPFQLPKTGSGNNEIQIALT